MIQNLTSPEGLVSVASLISIELSKNASIAEINIYKSLFSMISNNLGAIICVKVSEKEKHK